MDHGDQPKIRVLTRKWPDRPHWEFDAVRLGDDDHGEWVGVAEGTLIESPARRIVAACDHVVLLPTEQWWIATLYGPDPRRPVDTYVDIATPVLWSPEHDHATCVDLDLDVIRDIDGTVRVDDEDEFDHHRHELGYPDTVVAAALDSCAALNRAVRDAAPPFDGSHLAWLARFRAYRQP